MDFYAKIVKSTPNKDGTRKITATQNVVVGGDRYSLEIEVPRGRVNDDGTVTAFSAPQEVVSATFSRGCNKNLLAKVMADDIASTLADVCDIKMGKPFAPGEINPPWVEKVSLAERLIWRKRGL